MNLDPVQKSIDRLRDTVDDLEKCVDLLYEMQKRKGPLAETAIALKYQRPVLHKMLKSRLRHNPGLRLVLDL